MLTCPPVLLVPAPAAHLFSGLLKLMISEVPFIHPDVFYRIRLTIPADSWVSVYATTAASPLFQAHGFLHLLMSRTGALAVRDFNDV